MTAFGASNVLVRGPSRRGLALIVAAAVPAGLAAVCELVDPQLQEYVALLAAAEAIGFFFLPAAAPNGIGFINGERRGPLRADREGIGFRGRSVLSRAQIRNVAVEGLVGGTQIVHVTALRAKHDLHIELADHEAARALVAALELDPEKHVATFSVDEDPLRTRARWLAARLVVGAGALAVAGAVLHLAQRQELLLLALVPALLVYALLLPRARVRTDVSLAADGLTLRHRGRTRSIALAAIAEVKNERNEARLVLASGEELVLRFGSDANENAALQHSAFVARMKRAMGRRHRTPEQSELMLTRGARDASEWTRHVLAMAREEEGYRVASVPPDTLWRIAEGAASEPTARVGALVALRSRLDDDARAKLRELASRTAQSDLRAALEAAAGGAEADEIIKAYERAKAL
jgi:hypothetical protein